MRRNVWQLSRSTALAALLVITLGAGRTAHAADTPRIPLCPGLQIVTAVSQANGDYESIKTVKSVDPNGVLIEYSAEQLVTDLLAPDFGQVKRSTMQRQVRRHDLANATLYQQRFFADMATSVPETTAIGTSSRVLRALKSGGRSELSISNAYSGEFPADRAQSPSLYDFMIQAELSHVKSAPPMAVMVNNALSSLPVVHAKAEFAGEPSEFFFLDDEENPLTLKFRIGIDAEPPMNKEMTELCLTMQSAAPAIAKTLCGRTTSSDRESLQVIKISHRCKVLAAPANPVESGAAQLEQELEKSGRATVYDIHFSFNSDRIRANSAVRLAEIAAVLKKHPQWRLQVHGHTDSIGGDAYNLDLSKRRAAAVRNALITQHGIAGDRLVPSGIGAGQPRNTNDTLIGRARNRRVELIRQ